MLAQVGQSSGYSGPREAEGPPRHDQIARKYSRRGPKGSGRRYSLREACATWTGSLGPRAERLNLESGCSKDYGFSRKCASSCGGLGGAETKGSSAAWRSRSPRGRPPRAEWGSWTSMGPHSRWRTDAWSPRESRVRGRRHAARCRGSAAPNCLRGWRAVARGDGHVPGRPRATTRSSLGDSSLGEGSSFLRGIGTAKGAGPPEAQDNFMPTKASRDHARANRERGLQVFYTCRSAFTGLGPDSRGFRRQRTSP